MRISGLKLKHGIRDGIPIALGYLSVSFGFGITAMGKGLSVLSTVLISMTNLTSAGQVAGLAVIAASGSLLEMALTQLIINLRYSLMGISLTKKLDDTFNTFHRITVACFITDEIFAVASSKDDAVNPRYMYGLAIGPYLGWTLGTLLGAVAGQILPDSISSALGIAIYGMFVAIIVPPCKKKKGVLFATAAAVAISCTIKYLPFLSFITQGFAIIICAVAASALAAALFPISEEN